MNRLPIRTKCYPSSTIMGVPQRQMNAEQNHQWSTVESAHRPWTMLRYHLARLIPQPVGGVHEVFPPLLAYVRPYTLQAVAAVLFMAMVGLLDAFRVLLVKPIFDQVLKPSDITPHLPLFAAHGFIGHRVVQLNLEQLVPGHFHNAWTMVAFAIGPRPSSKASAIISAHICRTTPDTV